MPAQAAADFPERQGPKRHHLLVVTRGKKVTAVGIGDKRLTKSKKLTKKFLTAWKLG